MEIIRERYRAVCVIRSNTYASHFDYFVRLVAEARKDFPDLKDEDIKITHFGGQRYKHAFGIQFRTADYERIPKTYRKIHKLECLL